jgi:hypothetical protein
MPLTEIQARVARLLAANRAPDSYLAGGAALHALPNSARYSEDLDYFHDSVERVAVAFAADRTLLEGEGYSVHADMQQPGYIRAVVQKGRDSTKVEWAHDSAWRFMPTVPDDACGWVLHPIDLAINKLLALVGRDEPRDFIDVMQIQASELGLGPLVWAAAGKDPGFTPLSLLELLRRRGRLRPEDVRRLHLARPVDLPSMKTEWLAALDEADRFARSRPPEELGCLYWSAAAQRFVDPSGVRDAAPHFGRPGGVLPRIFEGD